MRYKNLHGFSSILSYDYGSDWIRIEFVDGTIRTYTYGDSGKNNVEYMKKCANRGAGLGLFIEKNKNSFKPDKKKRRWFF